MTSKTCDFKLMSFNVRGLRCTQKRRSIFRFIKRKNIDVCLLQESHSTIKDENEWRHEWGGDIFYSHGGHNSRGTMVLIKAGLDFKLEQLKNDQEGRLIMIKCTIQGTTFQLINIYAPNTPNARLNFFKNLNTEIVRSRNADTQYSQNTIIGGDFNTIQDIKLDRKGGNLNILPDYMKTIKLLDQMQDEHDLCDEWRLRNPETKRYTWRQKNPSISSRLDKWLISKTQSDSINEIDIIPSIKSDHSPIIMVIQFYKKEKGRGLWKLNNLDEEPYVKGITQLINTLKMMEG